MDIERVDPTLPTGEDTHCVADLDELRLAEVALQLRPERIVRLTGIPRDRIRIP
jgi:hypothetical protein